MRQDRDLGDIYRRMDWSGLSRWPGLPEERFWTVSRILSLGVVVGYVVMALVWATPADAFHLVLVSAWPTLLIWFPRMFGKYGRFYMRSSRREYLGPDNRGHP